MQNKVAQFFKQSYLISIAKLCSTERMTKMLLLKSKKKKLESYECLKFPAVIFARIDSYSDQHPARWKKHTVNQLLQQRNKKEAQAAI